MHFKLLNCIAASAEHLNMPKEHELSAHRLHSDLFLSGIDRIVLVSVLQSDCLPPSSKTVLLDRTQGFNGLLPDITPRDCTIRRDGCPRRI